jgi:ribosomal-protein-alanine N-acetyltransferase
MTGEPARLSGASRVTAAAGPGVPCRPLFPDRHVWPVRLEFEGVALVPFRRRDLAEWVRLRVTNRAWLEPWEATPPDGVFAGDVRDVVASNRREAKAGRMVPWLIRDGQTATRPLIGSCQLNGVTYGSARFASIGYWIGQAWAGRGIMPVAVALAADYAFQVVGLHRIEICVRPENAPSLRVVEKLGFRYEGIKPRYLHIAGDWRDHKCFALDASEVGPGLIEKVRGSRR